MAKVVDQVLKANKRYVAMYLQCRRPGKRRPGTIAIYGYIYDVRSGQLNEVPKATEAGKSR